MKSVKENLDRIVKRAKSMISSEEIDQLNLLQSFFRDIEASSREAFQEKVFSQAEDISRKLQIGDNLTSQEQKLLELLIIGDADYYIKIENNYEDWMKEYNRLLTEFEKFSRATLDVEKLCQLRAIAQDTLNLLPSIVYYKQAQIRIKKFRAAMHGFLEKEDKIMLASIIKTALESDMQ